MDAIEGPATSWPFDFARRVFLRAEAGMGALDDLKRNGSGHAATSRDSAVKRARAACRGADQGSSLRRGSNG